MADMTVAEIRALITRHKRWDLVFAMVGLLAPDDGERTLKEIPPDDARTLAVLNFVRKYAVCRILFAWIQERVV